MGHQDHDKDEDNEISTCNMACQISSSSNKYPNSRIWSVPSSSETPSWKKTTSVTIDVLLNSGKLVQPKPKIQTTLILEKFDIRLQNWIDNETIEVPVENEHFLKGGSERPSNAFQPKKMLKAGLF